MRKFPSSPVVCTREEKKNKEKRKKKLPLGEKFLFIPATEDNLKKKKNRLAGVLPAFPRSPSVGAGRHRRGRPEPRGAEGSAGGRGEESGPPPG